MMLKGNASETYTVSFGDGKSFSLMASNEKMATLLAAPLHSSSSIVKVSRNEDPSW